MWVTKWADKKHAKMATVPDTKTTAKRRGRPPKVTTAEQPPKRGRGRPPSETAAKERVSVRATEDERARWSAVVAERAEAAKLAGEKVQSEADWMRQGIDSWAESSARAMVLGMDPSELVSAALEDHERARKVVARLESEQRARALTGTEDAILRILSPATWERLGRAGALTLPPKQRRGSDDAG